MPAALPLASGAPPTPSAIKSRGRPVSRPEHAALLTFIDIDQLRRISLVLAPGDLPAEEREVILASLPLELRQDFQSIVGRQRRYGRRRSFSREEVEELVQGAGYFRDLLNRKPDSDAWAPEEMSKFDRVVELRATAFGPSATRQIEKLIEAQMHNAIEFGTRDDIYVMEGPATPVYVRGLWKRLDEWGAARHKTTLATFRSWRTKLRKRGELSTPLPRGQAKRVRDN
jgi:hypothetical protein